MANRSNNPIVRPIGSIGRAISEIFRAPQDTISGVETSQQFGPLQPFKPLGGPTAEPWMSPMIPGQNLVYTPRAREQVSSKDLRDASMYDLVRIIIENVEDQVTRLPLNIRLRRLPGESGKEYAQRKPDPGILRAIGEFVERPNADQTRAQFERMLFDDMLVIDAATVIVRRNLKGGVFDLRAVAGDQIARYFDSWGATPQPPNPAYAQIWDAGQVGGTGIPWVDLTTDQCLYAPRNLKTNRLYGLSPLEQALMMVRTAALRLEFQYDYYSAGSVPDAIQVVPADVTPKKLKEAQNSLNAELSGILFKRRQMRMIQGFQTDGKPDQFLFPKEALLKDEFDDYVIRVLCYSFGTSPQRLQRVMGMRSGQVNQDAAEKEGLEPWLAWSEGSLWSPIVRRYLGFDAYEATYQEDTSVDPHVQAQIDDINVRNGSKTLDEVREGRGDPPYQGIAESSTPIIFTPSGPVPLSADKAVERAKKMQEVRPQQEGGDNAPNDNAPGSSAKRKIPRINPGHETPSRKHARGRLESAFVKVFHRQREMAAEEASRLIKVLVATRGNGSRVRKDDSSKVADEIYAAIETEFLSLPTETREALEQAALSGIHDAYLQIDIEDSGIISSANTIAAEYASKRAAELIGMKYNESGVLVENPRAKWAISDTTRDRLREIIKNAFEDKTPFSEVIDDIRNADAFSDDRAAMIARTEVSRAQVESNLKVWKDSGSIEKVQWLAIGPDPCPICDENDGEVRRIGSQFSSGDLMPLAHPNCYCILQAVIQ